MAGGAASSTAPTNKARDDMPRAIKIRLFCLAGVDSPGARSQCPVNTANTAVEGPQGLSFSFGCRMSGYRLPVPGFHAL